MKTIPSQLLTHLGLPVTTWCFLVKVECVGPFAGIILAFTSLDIDVSYNDGDGLLLYESDNGFTPRRLQQTSNLSVDSSEVDGSVVTTPDSGSSGITEAQIRAGLFNSAKMTIYRVNYNDLTSGRHEVVAYGRAGETKFSEMNFNVEFRSLSQLLKQPINQVYSLTCIAKFGSTGVRWACNKPIVWGAAGLVTSVGAENDRQFTDTGRTEADGFYSDHGGIVRWLSGNNEGIEMEIDLYASDAFDLSLPLPYAIQVGDQYEPRIDCDFLFSTCRDVHANTDNFRGQNLIPVDGKALIPGAEIIRS